MVKRGVIYRGFYCCSEMGQFPDHLFTFNFLSFSIQSIGYWNWLKCIQPAAYGCLIRNWMILKLKLVCLHCVSTARKMRWIGTLRIGVCSCCVSTVQFAGRLTPVQVVSAASGLQTGGCVGENWWNLLQPSYSKPIVSNCPLIQHAFVNPAFAYRDVCEMARDRRMCVYVEVLFCCYTSCAVSNFFLNLCLMSL